MGTGTQGLKRTSKLSESQAIARIEQLARKIRSSATRLPGGEAEKRARLAEADKNFFFFAKTYFPHHFSADPASMHYKFIEAASEPGVIIFRMPRGFGKTTLGQIFALWCLLFGKKKYVILIGKSQSVADELVETLVLELEENERLIQDFGEQRTSKWSAQNGFRLKSGAFFRALGREQPIRGRKMVSQRPDLILADDLEDEELVRNPTRVKRVLKWFLQSVLPARARDATVVWLGTGLAGKSPTALLLDPEWSYADSEDPPNFVRLSFAARNTEGQSVWPEVWSDARLSAERATIGTTAFNNEFEHLYEMVGGMFHDAWFVPYLPKDLPTSGLVSVTMADPSVKAKTTSDTKAVITISFDPKTRFYYIRHAWIRRGTTAEFIKQLFDQALVYHSRLVIVETVAFAILLIKLIQDEDRARGVRLPVRCIEQAIGKEVRIQTVEPIAEQKRIHYIKGHSDQNELIEQFTYFPTSGKPDDGPDAFQMGVEFCERLPGDGKSKSKYESTSRRVDFRGI